MSVLDMSDITAAPVFFWAMLVDPEVDLQAQPAEFPILIQPLAQPIW
jgi:hypothetical protein